MDRKRILIAEDDAIVALDLKENLESVGYEVPAILRTGPEAIESARDLVPDLILMDVRLQGDMDGIEAARRIREAADVPIVFLTASGSDKTLRRAKEAGPHGFLLKPIQERQLFSAVEVAVQLHAIEKGLRHREAWFHSILGAIGDGVVASDADGLVTFMNPAAERLTGRSLANSKGLALEEVLRLSSGSGAGGSVFRVAAAGHVDKPIRATLCDARSRSRPIEYTATHNVDDRGQEGATVVVFRDISARLEAEEVSALQRSEERLRVLIDQGSDMVVVLNRDGTIKFTTHSIEPVLGSTPEDVAGSYVFDLFHRDDRQRGLDDLQHLITGNRTEISSRYRVGHRDGSWRTIEVRAKNLLKHPLVEGIVINARDVTERERMEEAVRVSERKYRGLFENAHDAIMLFRPEDETILEVNERACAMYGFDRSSFVGMSLMDISENRERGRRYVSETLEGGVLADVMSIHYRADGSPMVVEIQASTVEYEGDIAILSVNRDVSERYAAERAMERYTSRLAILSRIWQEIATASSLENMTQAALQRILALLPCESASVLLFDHARGTARVFVAAGDEALGHASGEVLPIGACVFSRPTDERVVVATDRPDASGAPDREAPQSTDGVGTLVGAKLEVEGELIGELDLASRQAGSFDSDDLEVTREVAGVLAVAMQQAHLRSRLKEHQQHLQALMDNLPEAVISIDRNNRITLANRAATEVIALLAETGPGDELTQLAGCALETYIDSPSGDSKHELVVAGPQKRVFEMAITRIHPMTETVSHILVLREVTRELDNRRLLQQQDRLASVGQLAAGIAHDFNNMLQAITGFAELIRTEEKVPETVVERSLGISRQCHRGGRLIRQILDFSRSSISAPAALDLEVLVKETLRMLERMIPENIQVRTVFGEGPLQTVADAGQLQQVITNIVVNARDAMTEGGELCISLRKVSLLERVRLPFPQMEPGEWLCLTISDSGSGIPEELIPRIYDPFFTTKNVGEGTGLGLAQVYGIVKQSNGFVDVESKLGVGTTFHVYLPPDDSEIVAPAAGSTATLGHGQLILLVEDEAPVLEAVRDTLERLDYAVIPTSSGAEALDVYEQCSSDIDLVISDAVMPGIGGLDLFYKLRSLDPGLPFVLMSGHPLRDRSHALEEKAGLAWISKPFTMDRLGAVISDLLSTTTTTSTRVPIVTND